LNYLFFILGEEGDACIIPAPYYAAFENDMGAMAKCKPFPCYMANASVGPTENELDIAYLQASSVSVLVINLCASQSVFADLYSLFSVYRKG
jgi:aspartate/methionine/tyrosine aminotransferase